MEIKVSIQESDSKKTLILIGMLEKYDQEKRSWRRTEKRYLGPQKAVSSATQRKNKKRSEPITE